jgi:hypothetical protein
MLPPCPNCGSTKNTTGQTNCLVCGVPYSGPASFGSFGSVAKPALTDPKGRKYFLSTTLPSLIGSKGCSVLVSAPGIESKHALLTPASGGFLIEPVNGSVLVNGAQVVSSTPLPPGATIQIGTLALTYSGAGVSAAPTALSFPNIQSNLSTLKTVPATPLVVPKSGPLVIKKMNGPGWFQKKPPALEGRVAFIDGPIMEDPDIDWAGLLLRCTFGLIVLPFMCWQPALILPFFIYGLNQRNRQTQTRYLRLEDQSGKQTVVKMKGDPVRGMVSMGDDLQCWGRWQNGNLKMDHAFNIRTNSDVRLRPVVQRRRNQAIIMGIVLVNFFFWLVFTLSS